MTPRAGWRADGVLLLITALWGATFVTVKDALALADPFSFLALRFAVGAVVAGVLAGRAIWRRETWRDGARLSVLLFVGYAFQTWGLELSTPSRSAFVTGLSVAMVPFFGWWLLRQRPGAWAFVGAAVAVEGLYLLTGVGAAPSPQALRGDALTLGCAAAFALHILYTSAFAARHAPLALVAVQLFCVSAFSAACLPFTTVHVVWNGELLVALLVTGVLASAFALGAQVWAQARTTAVRAALIYALESVFAALTALALQREAPTALEWLGGGVIIAGVLVGELGPRLRPRPSSP